MVFSPSWLLSLLVGIIFAFVMQRQEAPAFRGCVSREFSKRPYCTEVVRFEVLACEQRGPDLGTPEAAWKRDTARAVANNTDRS